MVNSGCMPKIRLNPLPLKFAIGGSIRNIRFVTIQPQGIAPAMKDDAGPDNDKFSWNAGGCCPSANVKKVCCCCCCCCCCCYFLIQKIAKEGYHTYTHITHTHHTRHTQTHHTYESSPLTSTDLPVDHLVSNTTYHVTASELNGKTQPHKL